MNMVDQEKQRIENSKEARAKEAQELIKIIVDISENLTPNEFSFFSNMHDRLVRYQERTYVSEKQIYWLRDIKSRYAE